MFTRPAIFLLMLCIIFCLSGCSPRGSATQTELSDIPGNDLGIELKIPGTWKYSLGDEGELLIYPKDQESCSLNLGPIELNCKDKAVIKRKKSIVGSMSVIDEETQIAGKTAGVFRSVSDGKTDATIRFDLNGREMIEIRDYRFFRKRAR